MYMDRGDLMDAAALFKFHELNPNRWILWVGARCIWTAGI